jgi:NifB/MoaA-like Fe-S oxidoreductase
MDQLRRLIAGGIEVHTQLVVVPGVNDGEWLARSIDDLAGLWPGVRSISVVPVGLTRQHKYNMRPHTPSEAAEALDYVLARQPEFLERFGVRFVYPTDEWHLVTGREVPPAEAYDDQALMENGLGMVRYFLDDWTAVQEEIQDWLQVRTAEEEKGREWPYERLTLITATLFAPILRQSAAEFSELAGVEAEVTAVPNIRLGETITVAGLLMAEDVIAHLQTTGYGDLIVLPRVMFDHPDTISLDDLTPLETANRLGRPVALADTMGDVWDVLTGDSLVVFQPERN